VRRGDLGLAQKRTGRGEVKNAEAGNGAGLLYPAIFVFP
jgi:hypothetical protein